MKCSKCMEKPLDWSGVPVKNICPKCGSEMESPWTDEGGGYIDNRVLRCQCGHEEKVKP